MRFIQYSLIVLLLSVSYSHAQEQPDRLQVAEKYFFKREYAYAAPLYEKLAAKKKVKPFILYKLAHCYDEMKQYEKALTWYTAYLTKDSAESKDARLRVADILKVLQRYTEAKDAYKVYLEHNPADAKSIAVRVNGCDSAIKWLQEKNDAVVRNEEKLNTPLSDWGAAFYGKELVFTSENRIKNEAIKKEKARAKEYGWTGNPYLSIYTTTGKFRDAIGDTVQAEVVGFNNQVNNYKYHVGPASFSAQLDTVYFTVTNDGKDPETFRYRNRWRYEKFNLELYYSVKKDPGQWQKPVAFAYNKPNAYSIGHAALSKDGSILYFTSDMPGGYGKTDIWFCRKGINGTWAAPENCGPVINTESEEAFPTIGADGDLYFSSTGHAGMGGLDIFSTSGAANDWSIPVNLKPPYNSGYDDFYYSVAADGSGYLSSDRAKGKGSDDIYSFAARKQPTPVTVPTRKKEAIVKNIVRNAADSSVIEGSIVTLATNGSADRQQFSDKEGSSRFPVDFSTLYRLKATYKGFISDSLHFVTAGEIKGDTIVNYLYLRPEPAPIVKQVTEMPYKVGDRFILEDLHYDYDKHNIRPDAAVILDRLVATLNKYPGLTIELSSHTDSRGSDVYNMALSQRRAESAVKYLISKGIAANRLQAKGYGESRLLNKCSNGVACSAEEHQRNRRTEVRVLKVE